MVAISMILNVFEEIREISVAMMAELSQLPAQKVADLFANENGLSNTKN